MSTVTVGVPTYDGLKTLTAFSLVSAVAFLRATGHNVHLSARQGPYTHWNREGLVDDAIDGGSDYLMMIDADLVFPADGIVRMLGREKDVIGGFYMMKMLPPTNTIKMGERDENGEYEAVKDWTPPQDPFQCSAVATGFMLIDMTKLKELERPWFPCVFPVGEDIAFCEHARAAGLEVWCDPTFKIDHLGDYHY